MALNKICILFFVVVTATACRQQPVETASTQVDFKASLDSAVVQYRAMDATVPDTLFPRSAHPDGSLWTDKSGWWTSGFFPGSLWYLYEHSRDPEILALAKKRTESVRREKDNVGDHDIGFKIYCSFGNGYRLTGDTSYLPVMVDAANTLIRRFNPKVGCTRSWGKLDDMTNPFLVIIDNMMNLELLFWATKHTGDSTYFNIAVTHADSTMKHHYRPDGSSWHVLEYDPNTGAVLKKRTAQGYSDESSWSRGQSWGLYGYVMTYRETGYSRYLDHATRIADYLVNHPNYPADGVPYWDYNAPDIPDALRDASAGSIMASALLELSGMVDHDRATRYSDAAFKILRSLSSDPYRAAPGTNHNFLLKHGVGNMPSGTEIDAPLSYGDYYYLEAVLRLLKLSE